MSSPHQVKQALDRVAAVLTASDLSPPDCVFILSQLIWTYHQEFDKRVDELECDETTMRHEGR
jgi:hypothetical protein